MKKKKYLPTFHHICAPSRLTGKLRTHFLFNPPHNSCFAQIDIFCTDLEYMIKKKNIPNTWEKKKLFWNVNKQRQVLFDLCQVSQGWRFGVIYTWSWYHVINSKKALNYTYLKYTYILFIYFLSAGSQQLADATTGVVGVEVVCVPFYCNTIPYLLQPEANFTAVYHTISSCCGTTLRDFDRLLYTGYESLKLDKRTARPTAPLAKFNTFERPNSFAG